jgi:hypothetical protein
MNSCSGNLKASTNQYKYIKAADHAFCHHGGSGSTIDTQDGGGVVNRRCWGEFHKEKRAAVSVIENMHASLPGPAG